MGLARLSPQGDPSAPFFTYPSSVVAQNADDGPLDAKRQKQLDWNNINKSLFSREAGLKDCCSWSKLHNSQILSEAATTDEGTYSDGVYCGVDQFFGLWQQ
jgi:hypothetical protein